MALAYHVRPLRTVLRSAAAGLSALIVGAVLAPAANAAPARPGAVAQALAPIETVAARQAHHARARQGKVAKKRRNDRGGSAQDVVVIRGGASGAAVASRRRVGGSDEPAINVQYYDYGGGGYSPYAYEDGRRRGGRDYDRRYWRGGGPGHDRPSRGYSGDRPAIIRPRPGQNFSGDDGSMARPRPGQGYSGDVGAPVRPGWSPDHQRPQPRHGQSGYGGGRSRSDAGGYTFAPQSGWMAGPPIMQMAPAPTYSGPIQPGGVPLNAGGVPISPPSRGR